MCKAVLPACLYDVPRMSQEGIDFPQTGVLDGCESPCRSWNWALVLWVLNYSAIVPTLFLLQVNFKFPIKFYSHKAPELFKVQKQFKNKQTKQKPCLVALACNLVLGSIEAGELLSLQGQPGLALKNEVFVSTLHKFSPEI